MRPKGKRHATIPVPLGGMFSAGDASTIPAGTSRRLRNYSVRPDGGGLRLDARAPFVYDGLDTISGFAVWQDITSDLTKTIAIRSADQKIYTKNASGQTYGAGVAGLPSSTRLTSYTNFLRKLYMMFDNGAGVPSAVATWDGTTVVTAPFNTTLLARTVTAFISRLFFTDVTVTIGSQNSNFIYSWANGLVWTATNVNAFIDTVGTSTTVGRIAPTSSAASACSIIYNDALGGVLHGMQTVTASTKDAPYVWRGDFRGVHPTYNVPLTMELLLVRDRANNAVYAQGDMIVIAASDTNNYRYRCTTAGTSAGAPPVFTPTLGGTTADNTATWTNEGSDVLGAYEGFVLNATLCAGNWLTFFASATVPPRTNTVTITPRLKLHNSQQTAQTTLAPIDMSFGDAFSDGDPRKQNRGQQLTAGDFYFPFVNTTAGVGATQKIDSIIWSEINNPQQILAKNTFPLSEVAGVATAAIVWNGKFVVFKRKGMWVFRGVADINEPILPETNASQVGCLGPLAVDVSRENTLYWISEQHICAMKPGESTPTFIDSPGMYEEIMARGASWVESQATYNSPLLAVDHANREVWVYTQQGKIYIYNIDTQAWGYFDANPNVGVGPELQAMMFDPVGNRMIASFGGASATRFDETSDAKDTIVTGGGTSWDIESDITFKPFELFAPRYEATLLELGVYQVSTLSAAGSVGIIYSFDRGNTLTTLPYTFSPSATLSRFRIPLALTGPSVTITLGRAGAGGKRNWAISKCDALLRVHRGEIPYVNST